MTTALLDDEFWRVIEPLLPVRKRRFHHPGRKRLDDRRTLAGILFVLRTGIAWKRVPRCGCGWYLTSLQTAVSGWPGTAHSRPYRTFPASQGSTTEAPATISRCGRTEWVSV